MHLCQQGGRGLRERTVSARSNNVLPYVGGNKKMAVFRPTAVSENKSRIVCYHRYILLHICKDIPHLFGMCSRHSCSESERSCAVIWKRLETRPRCVATRRSGSGSPAIPPKRFGENPRSLRSQHTPTERQFGFEALLYRKHT